MRDIKPKVDRKYVTLNQPWSLDALPPRYLHPTTKWYPPIFCLRVALSFEETVTFAKRLDIPTDRIGQHTHLIAIHLTEACGADPPVTVMRGDRGGGPDDCIWLISLATNYDVSEGLDVNEPLGKCREIVKRALGPPKEVGWWLEYTTNHDPGHWWVSDLLLRLESECGAYVLIMTCTVARTHARADGHLGCGEDVSFLRNLTLCKIHYLFGPSKTTSNPRAPTANYTRGS